ncbi:hypothetical protein [Kitasatospora cathayae]|uniref:Uncharacterized protein n=1 Tax=Kitasatospora cathayae TaxID=3004092 RepID=A0ABY7QHH1_9ACTN|nr:hypothetical protein [Kitasatospora sp. HUAS 3-15]WBP91987.1 hypothetical protein O1G21_40055 [Kitasatospora sp. HUAS 3-15]
MARDSRDTTKPQTLPARLLAALVVTAGAVWLLGELYARLTH